MMEVPSMSRSKHPHGITCLAQDPLGMLESHVLMSAKRWLLTEESSFAASMHAPLSQPFMQKISEPGWIKLCNMTVPWACVERPHM